MNIGNWFRNIFSSPESAEDAADLHEEYGAPEEGGAELKRDEDYAGGGGGMAGLAGQVGAEAAEADLSEFEAPEDLAP